jgi:hypothetical protein
MLVVAILARDTGETVLIGMSLVSHLVKMLMNVKSGAPPVPSMQLAPTLSDATSAIVKWVSLEMDSRAVCPIQYLHPFSIRAAPTAKDVIFPIATATRH